MSQLILVGSSVRAAAESALRAGFEPWCVDRFADADLRRLTPRVRRCPAEDWPHGISAQLADAPQAPWLYTGGLENHPDLLAELAARRPLWGNGPPSVLPARSPFFLAKWLGFQGLLQAEVRDAEVALPPSERWLRKPYRGSGGGGIQFVTVPLPEAEARLREVYHQRFLDGPPHSSVFVGDGEERATLLGTTRQRIGEASLHAPPFAYCGNAGPIDCGEELEAELRRLGDALVGGCKLRGLFGVDWVWHLGRPWLIEVNPRYPASLEVLELAHGAAYLRDHAGCFAGPQALPDAPASPPPAGWVSKAILYARRDAVAPDFAGMRLPVTLADVPAPGEPLPAGWPVLTILCGGDDAERCEAAVAAAAAELSFTLERGA